MERHGLHLSIPFASHLTVSKITKHRFLEDRLACSTLPSRFCTGRALVLAIGGSCWPLPFAARVTSLQDRQRLPGLEPLRCRWT